MKSIAWAKHYDAKLKRHLRVLEREIAQEQQSTMHAAGLVAVHAAGDDDTGLSIVPGLSLDAEERVSLGVHGQRAVLHNVERRLKRWQLSDDVVGIGATRLSDVKQPRTAFGGAPGREWPTDGVEVIAVAHVKQQSVRYLITDSCR